MTGPRSSASWSVWIRRFASVYGALSCFSAMLGSTVDTICVRPRIFSYSSAMLGLTVETCRVRRRVGSGMVFAGLLVMMISRCVHFVVGRPVEYPHVQSLRQFQLLALPAGMRGRLFGALCTGTGRGVMSTGT